MPVSAKPLFFLCAFILSQLTAMQKTIAVFLQNFLERTPDQQLFRFVSGPAGTGKTILLHYLRDVIVRHFDTNAACRLAASTGTAAWNIHGATLHSLIKLSIENEDAFQVLDGPTLDTLRKELTGMKFLFIDEVSMMSAKALSETSSILQRVFLSHLPFGGVSVFLFGDLLQLEPVNGEGIFEDLPMCYLPERNARSTNPNNDPLHENLFQLFKTFHLTKCVRAEKEEDVELLMKIRRGDTDKAMFRQLELKCGMSGKFPSEIFAELETLESANRGKSFIILTAGNNDAKQLNDYKIGKIGEITSLKRVRATPSPSMPETSFRKVTGFVPFVKNVAIGCRIMLTYNKCSRRGLGEVAGSLPYSEI
ncbi:hypothetical protein GCK72_015323 [Caenorhabditis remanei]|nr:hypothetical protein GCK72_015323 [Caenorhabditis remanei]KAF1758863.1 hypothetical protein GCK72_015323 [Caenorhabditis remanei]